MKLCKYTASMYVHKYASMQVCKYASMQVCKYAKMQYSSMQVCKYVVHENVVGGSSMIGFPGIMANSE